MNSLSSGYATLLIATSLLCGVAAISWALLAFPGRMSPPAARRFAVANLLLAGAFWLTSLRDSQPGYLSYHAADFAIFIALSIVRDGVQKLLRLRTTRLEAAWVLGLAGGLLALQAPSVESHRVLGLIFSLTVAWIVLRMYAESLLATRREFGWQLALAPGLAFALTGAMLLLRVPMILLNGPEAGVPAVDEDLPYLWAGFVLALLFNIALAMLMLVRLVQRVNALATSDALTGLLNRRGIEPRLRAECRRVERSGEPLSIVCIDLDHFKAINDQHGHAAGDAVLVHAARLLAGALRGADALARLGGEELVVALPNTCAESARQIAERMRGMLEAKPLDWNGQPIQLTASFGIATSDLHPDPEAMQRDADLALYRAKQAGRNRVVLFAG